MNNGSGERNSQIAEAGCNGRETQDEALKLNEKVGLRTSSASALDESQQQGESQNTDLDSDFFEKRPPNPSVPVSAARHRCGAAGFETNLPETGSSEHCREWRYLEHVRNQKFDNHDRPSETELRRLDSSLKKCTGFIRRIRALSLTEEAAEGLARESKTLNLSRYLSEVVASIAETKVKSSDVEYAAHFCGELHRRYPEFATLLAEALASVISSSARDIALRRSAMRILVEMMVVGVIDQPMSFVPLIRDLMKSGRDSSDEGLANMSVVATCAKTAGQLIFPQGAEEAESPVDADRSVKNPSRREINQCQKQRAYLWETQVFPSNFRSQVSSMFLTYFRELSDLFSTIRDELQESDAALRSSRLNRGIEDGVTASSMSTVRKTYDRVYSACQSIAEALDKSPPEQYVFVDTASQGASTCDASSGRVRVTVDLFGANSRSTTTGDGGTEYIDCVPDVNQRFETEAERLFYTELPDLSKGIPAGLESVCGNTQQSEASPEKETEEQTALSHSSGSSTLSENARSKSATIFSPPDSRSKSGRAGSHSSGERAAAKSSASTGKGSARSVGAAKRSKQNFSANAPTLDSLLAKLTSIDSAKQADYFVFHFCSIAASNRSSCKRLIKQLTNAPPHLLNVLPAYARIAASLRCRYPEIVASVTSFLEEDLRTQIPRSDHDDKSIACSIRTARYIGELVKFELLSSATFFDLVGLCVRDFTGHKVEVLCHLLESCGRFLFRSPHSHERISTILDTIWRLKSVRNLEARLNAMVETAYFASKPQGSAHPVFRKRLDPMREYICTQVYSFLEDSNADKIAVRFRKLPWDNDLEVFLVKVFLNVSYFRFSRMKAVAKLLSAIAKYRNSVGMTVCDTLLEHICLGMERNDGRDSQRRVAQVVLLGEIFNHRLLNSPVIFQILYEFISFGHSETYANAIPSTFVNSGVSRPGVHMSPSLNLASSAVDAAVGLTKDPPGDYFRIRLVCTLLDICAGKLATPRSSRKRSTRRQLEVFWAYFDRYVMLKMLQADKEAALPLHIDHLLLDTSENVKKALFQKIDAPKKDSTALKAKSKSAASERHGKSACVVDVNNDVEVADASPISRSKSLEDAMHRISNIESTPSDVNLVFLPQRRFVKRADRLALRSARHQRVDSLGDRSERLSSVASDDDTAVCSDDGSDSDQMTCESTVDNDCSDPDEIGGAESNTGDTQVSGSVADFNAVCNEESEESSAENLQRDDVSDDEHDDDDDDDDEFAFPVASKAKTEQEDEFEKELAAFTATEVQSAKRSFTGHSALDRMAIPIGLMAKRQESDRASALATAFSNHGAFAPEDNDSIIDGKNRKSRGVSKEKATVPFKFLVRRGGKSQIRDLHVPSKSSLAVAAKQSETKGAAAHAELKRLVLESNAVLDSDEDDEMNENDIWQDSVYGSRERERNISEQRAADERALLMSLFRGKGR